MSKEHEDKYFFLGIRTDDWERAISGVEKLLNQTVECRDSTYLGGKYCKAKIDNSSFYLRTNHHNDGAGWSWCIKNEAYPLVLDCRISDKRLHNTLMERLKDSELIEMPSEATKHDK